MLPWKERLHRLRLPTLVLRRKRADMIMTYWLMAENVTLDKHKLFTMCSHFSRRGHNYKVLKNNITRISTDQYFRNRIINDWNKLPSDVVNVPTTVALKIRLDLKEYTTNENNYHT